MSDISNQSIDLFAPTGPTEIPEDELPYIPHRIFINQLDTFNNEEIVNVLSDEKFKAFHYISENEDANIEEQEEEQESEWGEDESEEKFMKQTALHKVAKTWQIIGTVKQKSIKHLDDVHEILKFEQTDEFLTKLFKCSVVIFDITNDPEEIVIANWILDEFEKRLTQMSEESTKKFKALPELRIFILISTVMTWALTKPLNPYDTTLPFQEDDYRKRKPHPNYKIHTNLEKKTVKCGKTFPSKFKTIVVAAGIVYGLAENDLSFLFEWAWLNNPERLPIFGNGKNFIPLIHVKDLANIIVAIIRGLPKIGKQYILAVEQQLSRFRTIVKAIGKTMGTGDVTYVLMEEALLYPSITQTIYERVTVNLALEPDYILSELSFTWQTDLSLPQNALSICQEFKDARNLAPIKIVIHGPPAAGKTRIAKRLCEHYHLTYINVKSVIEETISWLEKAIMRAEAAENIEAGKDGDEDVEEEEEDLDEIDQDDKPTSEDYRNQLEEIQNESKNGKITPELLTKLIKQKMYTNKLLNQGWVLDGYPKTMDEAKDLFGLSGDDDDEFVGEDVDLGLNINKLIMPQYVISLTASDEFLCERVMNLPESEVQGTHYVETHMIRRLEEFRALNTDDDTVLNFYDEAEVHPDIIDVMQDDTPEMEDIFQQICKIIGKHRHLGPSKAELEEEARLAELQRIADEERSQKEQKELAEKLEKERLLKMENWAEMMLEMEKEEAEILSVKSVPLRDYLVKNIFPTLTKGLLEVAKIKPDDPIDYLAEYLFKQNPEGRMFDPAYTEAAGEFMDAIQQLGHAVVGNVDELKTLRQHVENRKQSNEKSPK